MADAVYPIGGTSILSGNINFASGSDRDWETEQQY